MKVRGSGTRVVISLRLASIGCLVIASLSSPVLAQGSRSGQSNLSAEEQTMVNAIMAAPDPAAKLKAVDALIKKHPTTPVRERVARETANQIGEIKDAARKVTLAQQYQGIFTEASEQPMIIPILIDGLVATNRVDDAFSRAAEFLTHNPDSLFVLVQLTSLGTDQAKAKNPKFISQSLRYGSHAIGLIEADKKPADVDNAGWQKYKTTQLPILYQSVGILNVVKGDRNAARTSMTKATELAPTDPFNYLLLADILNSDYQDGAKHYQTLTEGPARDQELKKVLAALDSVIDAFAHTVALAEGNERLAPVRMQYLQDLESYYKFRHNNSTQGMQQLIDKYKVTAK